MLPPTSMSTPHNLSPIQGKNGRLHQSKEKDQNQTDGAVERAAELVGQVGQVEGCPCTARWPPARPCARPEQRWDCVPRTRVPGPGSATDPTGRGCVKRSDR